MEKNLSRIIDEKIVNDVAKSMLCYHIAHKGNLDSMPSKSGFLARNEIANAYCAIKFPGKLLRDINEEQKDIVLDKAGILYPQACKIADTKWKAAMTLLGLDD